MATKSDRQHLEALGARIQRLRKERGLSQEGLGEKAGVTGKYLSEVERGNGNLTFLVLRDISVALKVTPARLLAEPNEIDVDVSALLANANKADRLRAIRILKALMDE